MLTVLKTLYNNGENNGDMTIITKNNKLKCHSFVVNNTSDFFKFNNTSVVNLEYDSEIINITLNFMYTEKIIDKNIPPYSIIQLFDLINLLKCSEQICQLKKYYTDKFSKQIDDNNWLQMLKTVFNIQKYNELQEILIQYYNNKILLCDDVTNYSILKESFSELDNGIKYLLFSNCLDKLASIHNDLSDYMDKKIYQKKKKINNCLKKIKSVDDRSRNESDTDSNTETAYKSDNESDNESDNVSNKENVNRKKNVKK